MSSPGIQTTHVGSLPRPATLRQQLEAGDERDPDTVAEAVTEAVRLQHDAGLDVINDGEQGRISYSVAATRRMTGFSDGTVDRDWPADLEAVPAYGETLLDTADNISGPVATGPISYTGSGDLREELAHFERATTELGIDEPTRFHTAPSPGAINRFAPTETHDSPRAYLFDLADALRTEYEVILEHVDVLQIDAPDLLAGYTLSYKEADVAAFRDHVATHIEAINRAVPDGETDRIRLHACWGNYPGPHDEDIELVDVVDCFYEAAVSGLVIEGAMPRHRHAFDAFTEHPLPADWDLIAGVVDVKTNVVEHPTVVADRLVEAVDQVGDPSRVLASPDCGFETVVDGANGVHPSVVPKKLKTLVAGARRANDRLE